ncbi:MAG: Zn-dependent hydrolase [Alphaproteobacteria bacterium]|jgi:N-carbamoyl-L-amino-acid hydrolase|nr:Zn-dependent hydrolase [Alphaproteobacteria bacterium]MDP6237167.1 Zn-dependent hydrolase [Alphaproteobacteria bacterium]MDP7172441.1 Zn-dependent hydrolase [Alphaproteobacteria bacterium]
MSKAANRLCIDGGRLWQSLMTMAEIGATAKGGVCRLALSETDRDGRRLFAEWAEAAGCRLSIDGIGNMFAHCAGRDDSLAPVLVGSHLDSQPTGGKFDGAYGVLSGLEVVRALQDAGIETLRPIEIVNWTNEEGSRFAPAMMGSGTYSGALALEEVLAQEESGGGQTVAEALTEHGLAGDAPVGERTPHAYFEAHIEQGPILEAEGHTIGIVTAIQGLRWFDCRVEGMEAHAGPMPMPARKDALLAASRLVERVNAIALEHAPDGRGTVGEFRISPDSRNVIPGSVHLGIDMRHPDADALAAMAAALRVAYDDLEGYGGTLNEIWYSPPTLFDPTCVAAVRNAADALGASYREITSGAGHDAKYMADICPSAMVFIPCRDGISHNEIESAEPEHATVGVDVLLLAVLEKAQEPG